jgi:hypothetical protein
MSRDTNYGGCSNLEWIGSVLPAEKDTDLIL